MTHPFHPLFGREFELADVRQAWGEDRVYFRDDRGFLVRMPTSWTDVVPPDVEVSVTGGRCDLRVSDLVQLVSLIGAWRSRKSKDGSAAGGVKGTTPHV